MRRSWYTLPLDSQLSNTTLTPPPASAAQSGISFAVYQFVMQVPLRSCLAAATAAILLCASAISLSAQTTTAQRWNEQLLEAIRNDFARPTVHARNLLHTTIALYDAYAIYDAALQPVMLGQTYQGVTTPRPQFARPADIEAARRTAMSYAAYRILRRRFAQSPGRSGTNARIDSVMQAMGYNTRFTSIDYAGGDPAALGNWIALQVINFGLTDGANESVDYAFKDSVYLPVNPPLTVNELGNPNVVDIDRWQPLALKTFIDQSGNLIPGAQQTFIGPQWGDVKPFALDARDRSVKTRAGRTWNVYHDPGPPPMMANPATRAFFQRNNEMVVRWSALLDPQDTTTVDLSPAAQGEYLRTLPTRANYFDYYREFEGGEEIGGLSLNPVTGQPYAPNRVLRADYYRVLAEFWADGPDSETPPGHWFTILNHVLEQPELVYRWRGQGPVLPREQYVLQTYLCLGGAVHDAAISAWSAKGFYDAGRPVSVIRYMAEKGQRSDPSLPRYHEEGLALIAGQSELVKLGDPLAGDRNQFVNEVKVRAWRAHDAIGDPLLDAAGVDWVLAKAWWPYQLRTFVSPPFAGYVSGHSTFSRAAAEVMSYVTGSDYFPGGLGTFNAPAGTFLKFESGPTKTFDLTWATYRGAADEVSLSRIYGGIHAPYDDIPGRAIGIEVGLDALAKAQTYFDAKAPTLVTATASGQIIGLGVGLDSTVAVELVFSEAIDTTTLLVKLPAQVDPMALALRGTRWLDDRTAQLRFAARIPQYAYDGVRLTLSAKDLYGNALPATTTVPLFDYRPGVLGVRDGASELTVILYPNPSAGEFQLRTEGFAERYDVSIFDVSGRLVRAQRGSTDGQRFDVSLLAPGIYTVQLSDESGGAVRRRLVRQ